MNTLLLVTLAWLSLPSQQAVSAAAGQPDEVALRALDQAYAARWMAGDADGVMALFTDDATIVPHHGDAPIKGKPAIERFWFHPDYPPTRVSQWHREATEVFVSGDVGVIRGRFRMVWEYEGVRTTVPAGNYVMVAVREHTVWRIRLLTWNDDPRSWTRQAIE